MKAVKIIAVVLAVLLAGYAIFVAADSVRLRKASLSGSGTPPTKPLVTVSQDTRTEQGSDRLTYTGLGYAVTYETSAREDGTTHVDGAEFRLFGRILLWAWIA